MTRNKSLAIPPPDISPATGAETDLQRRIETALKAYTPAEAADLMGVTENWVTERMNAQTIPFTYVGKFRRMRAKHILAVLEANEVDPATRGRKANAA